MDNQCGKLEEGAVTLTTEDMAELSDEHTGRITQANVETCRSYYESISEYVATIDAFYHFPTGLSIILGTFVAYISLYYAVNATTEEDISFLIYLLCLSAFLLVICLQGKCQTKIIRACLLNSIGNSPYKCMIRYIHLVFVFPTHACQCYQ